LRTFLLQVLVDESVHVLRPVGATKVIAGKASELSR